MYITYLSSAGLNQNFFEIKKPKWNQIKKAISVLDGINQSALRLEKQYDNHFEEFMMIESCREFCTAEYKLYRCRICSTEKAPGEWYLYDPSQSSEEFIEAAYDDIPRNEALNLKTILKAAKTYAESGQRDKSLHWMMCLPTGNIDCSETNEEVESSEL